MHSRIPRLKPLSRFTISLLLLLSVAGLLPLRAQQVEMSVVAAPELIPDDPDAASYYRQTDVNDKVCALIKVKPSNPMGAVLVLNTGGGMAPVPPPKGQTSKRDDGEWWYWLSPDTKNIYFTAEGYQTTAPLGVSLQPGKVYRLNLTVGAALHVISEFKMKTSVMKLNILPKECVVSYGLDANCDMDRVTVQDGYFEAVLNEGTYYYKIENPYFTTYTGTYILSQDSKEEAVSLQPAYGYLRVTSEPSGAEVFLDGSLQSAGKTPFTTGMLTQGPHSVRLWKEDYYAQELKIQVAPTAQVQDIPPVSLKPQFGTVTCWCEDPQAELIVTDGANQVIAEGKSGMKVQLNSRGSYKLEATREGYASQSVGIQGGKSIEGQNLSISVGAPVPLYGGLQVSSEPRRAEVWVDGQKVGTTTYISRVLVGNHKVELKLDGYQADAFTVTVLRDQETVVSRKLEKPSAIVVVPGSSGGGSLALQGGRGSQTANCYIVSNAGTYSFPTVKGNSWTSVGNVSRAEVLWESFGTSTAPSKGDIIQSVSYSPGSGSSAGDITLSTPSTLKNGNAVVAAKDASGNILWSWHIWVCKDYDPVATAQTYYNNAGVMMDRNLGATSATPGDVGALGLLYQWGRKDPFLGSSSISSSTKAKSTLSWPSNVSSNSSNGTIAYATTHPTTFITSNDSNHDWYYTGSSSTDNTRWQSSKTIYDPCPPGWRVPDGGSNGVWSKAVGSSSSFSDYPYDSTNKGMNFSGKFASASTIWYPAAGCMDIGGGSLDGVGYAGSWWAACTPYDNYACRLYLSSNGDVNLWSRYSRAIGLSVRCLQE